jgi:ribosomal protein S25
MQMAMEVLDEVDPNAVMATDGSVEGILRAASQRPGRPGVFKRDEFSGLLAGVAKKEYLAGLLEALCYLYDGTYYKRELTRGVIEVRDPVFIMFVAGVTNRILERMDETHILSGFAPRFIFVSPQGHSRKRVPIGHMTVQQDLDKDDFVKVLTVIQDRYKRSTQIQIAGAVTTLQPKWEVRLTDEALARYNKLDEELERAAAESSASDLYGPMMGRLAASTLKVAMLIAAGRQDPSPVGHVILDLEDMITAISFTRKWVDDAVDVAKAAGLTVTERLMRTVFGEIERAGSSGKWRSELMRHWHLDAKVADQILETLDQRGLIRRVNGSPRKGTERIFAANAYEA